MHNIEHWVFEEKVNRKNVVDDIQDYAEREGDGYSGPLKWHDEVEPLASREEAEEWIRVHDKGWYDDHAVRFYDYSKAEDTKKITELKGRFKETCEKIGGFQEEHSVRNFKAEYIGCSGCGSKIARKYLRSEFCPVCHRDLRSEGVLSKLEALISKRAEIEKKIAAEKAKQTGKRQVLWLVKFEFHS